jgi:hypothetical protein
MTTVTPTRSFRLRRLMPAALIAATAALGGSALADPAVACAAPNTGGYDDARYEECRKSGLTARFCCSQAGGTWTEVKVYDKNGNQVSSYYMCTGSASKPAQSDATNPGVIGTVPLEPATEPSVSRVPTSVIQTLTPSAASPVS